MSATCTAQILIGGSNHGVWGGPEIGIGPNATLYLVEGSRAAWAMERVRHATGADDLPDGPITWVASRPDRILSAALLMIAARGIEIPEVIGMLEDLGDPKAVGALLDRDWADLGRLDQKLVVKLERLALEILPAGLKVIVSPMVESSIMGQLGILADGEMDAEVLMPIWTRRHDSEGKVHVEGELPPIDPGDHRFTAVRL